MNKVTWNEVWAEARIAIRTDDGVGDDDPNLNEAWRCLVQRQYRTQPLRGRLETFKAKRWAAQLLG